MSLFEDLVKVNDLLISEEEKALKVKSLITDPSTKGESFPDNIRLESMQFLDFRLFRNAELNLTFPLTVLVGVNGRGKTSILEAIVHHLTWLIAKIGKEKGTGSSLVEADISKESLEGSSAQVVAVYKVGGEIGEGKEKREGIF